MQAFLNNVYIPFLTDLSFCPVLLGFINVCKYMTAGQARDMLVNIKKIKGDNPRLFNRRGLSP